MCGTLLFLCWLLLEVNNLFSVGAAAAKPRMDLVVRNAIQAGDIPGPRYLANGQEVCARL